MHVKVDPIDQAHLAYKSVLVQINSSDKAKWTEADTRLRAIDRILFEVLGWNKDESNLEDKAGRGYSDYTLKISNSARLIVEAKKDAIDFELGNRRSASAYQLNGAVFNTSAKDAIGQAIIYSAYKSCELACVTNGSEWIILRANRLGDGQDILEGKGFIFSSLEDIEKHFRLFYDLLSRTSVEALRYRGEFQTAEGVPVRDSSFLKALRSPTTKKLQPRSEFASDFDAIMSSFFERLKGDQDPEMIQKCFVETNESQLASSKLLRIAEDLVDKVKNLDTSTGDELIELIEEAKLQHKNRFILLVGNKGAGKSTFIDRFFRFTLPREIADGLVLLRLDLSINSGEVESVVSWLNHRLIEECEKVVFPTEAHDWDDWIGRAFFDEYQRWSNGTMSHLYKTDKNTFKIEFGRHIEKMRENQPHEYIKRLISYITKTNKKIPCLVFDNTDHFGIGFQEAVFQYARSIYESEFCVVLVPITDKTSWQLSKQGSLQSFESEVLSLPVPDAKKVIERRISFLIEKLNSEDKKQQLQYFLARGIRLKLENIGSFAISLNRIFLEAKETAHWIGGLANFDIRRFLELTKDLIASPHLKLDDLVKAHIAGNSEVVPTHRIKQAIIKRRYDIYPSGEHSFVQNLFALKIDPPTSPLLGARILQFLCDAGYDKETQEQKFVQVSSVYEHFTAIGIHPQIADLWLAELLLAGLISNYDPTIKLLNESSLIEASPSGRIHLTWATADVEYIQMMKDVTPLRDKDIYEELQSHYRDYRNKWSDSVIAFIGYLLFEDAVFCHIPDHPNFSGQMSITKRLLWRSKRLQDEQNRRQ